MQHNAAAWGTHAVVTQEDWPDLVHLIPFRASNGFEKCFVLCFHLINAHTRTYIHCTNTTHTRETERRLFNYNSKKSTVISNLIFHDVLAILCLRRKCRDQLNGMYIIYTRM